ncbi:MAG: thioredoxin [Acidobacteria bacterium]|nr:MAG: thioredoxin [Acidobacteriota bacterium]
MCGYCFCEQHSGIFLPMSHFRVAPLLCISAFFAATTVAQNRETSKPKQPVATVDGQTIYDDDLASSVQGQLLPLRNQEYEINRKALDNLIEQKLLEAAAKKKGLTTEKLLAQEVDSKVPDPSDAELEGYYLGLKDKISRPFADIKTQLAPALKNAKIQQARQDYLKTLRADSNVAVLLSAPRVEVGYDPARVRGNPKAPVMIVEFSDYQCPYCHQVEPTVKEVLAKYGDKVSLAYRDYPLTAIHSQAEIAAEASRCALEQGRFWEYHDNLYTASNLDKDALIEYARKLKLDNQQFGACLTSGKYKAEIDKDLEEGRKAGVSGTPGFFINGIVLSGSQPKGAFTRVIDEELARKANHATASIRISRAER